MPGRYSRSGEVGDAPKRVVGRRTSTAVPPDGPAALTRKAHGPPSPTTRPPIKRTRKHKGPPSPRLLRPIGNVSTRAYGTRRGKHSSSDENSRPISPYSKSNRQSRLGPANTKLVKTPTMTALEKQNSQLRRELQDLKVALGAEKQNTHAFIERNTKNMQQIQLLTSQVQQAKKQAQEATKEATTAKKEVADVQKGLAVAQASAHGISQEAQKVIDETKEEAMKAQQSVMEAERIIASLKAQHKRDMEEMAAAMRAKHKEEMQSMTADMKRREESLATQIQDLEAQLKQNQNSSQGELQQFKDDCARLREERNEYRSRCEADSQSLEAMKERLGDAQAQMAVLGTSNQEFQHQVETLAKEQASKDRRIEEMELQARKELMMRKTLHNQVQELKGNIRVYCRVRPLLRHEVRQDQSRTSLPTRFPDGPDQRQITLEGERVKALDGYSNKQVKLHQFEYDRIFKPEEGQEEVFEEIQQLVQSAIDGYKVSIFAYGQTGSGKTYTMQGEGGSSSGMIPRAVEHLFNETQEMKSLGWNFKFCASFLEIYNEEIRDLLSSSSHSSSSRSHNIKLVKTAHGLSTEVAGVKEVTISSAQQLLQLVQRAFNNRATGSTKLNSQSSRSHSVFRLRIMGVNRETEHRTFGTLNMIDLAGSERIKKSGAQGSVQREAVCINKSLSCLGDVIMALGNKEKHVPYRNSKLTHLLQDSFGADNSKTLMFVNISPLQSHVQESLCSLRFAAKVNNCQIGTARRNVKM